MHRLVNRRAALLGGAGLLLAGCETTQDMFDRVVGTSKTPLPGERRAVLAAERGVAVDTEAANRALGLPEARLNAEWPVSGGTPGHAPGHLALGRSLAQAWRASIGSGNAYRRRMTAQPLVVGDTLFAADAFGYVTALDLARGSRRWQTDTRPRRDRDGALGAAIAFSDGTLYVATGLAEVMALDPASGEIRWRAPLPTPARGGMAVAGDRILVPTVENHLIGLARDDGRRIWTYRAAPVQALPLGLPAPAIEGDVAVAGFASGEIVAVRIADGRVQWSESLGGGRGGGVSISEIGAITALPVIDRGRVFALGMAGAATSLDLRSGRRVWEREVGGSQTPYSAGDWVFALSRSGALLALGRDDGRVRWITPLPGFEDEARRRRPINWGPPVLAGGRLLIAGSHGQLQEVDASSGELLGRTRLPDGCTLQPVIANGTAFLLTDGGDVVALRGVA
jgi:outer membrane protein assembly factor BamB